MYNAHTMLQKRSFECTRVLIFKREKIRRLEYALFLLVLWRLGVETGRHGDPRMPGHLGCSCIQFLLNIIDDHSMFFYSLWPLEATTSRAAKGERAGILCLIGAL